MALQASVQAHRGTVPLVSFSLPLWNCSQALHARQGLGLCARRSSRFALDECSEMAFLGWAFGLRLSLRAVPLGSPTGGCFCECLFTSVVHLSVVSVPTDLGKFNMDANVVAIRALSLFTLRSGVFETGSLWSRLVWNS